MTPTSGTDIRLTAGEAEVHVASIGASLRRYQVRGVDLVVPFAADEVRPAYRGATLAPWPNRVVQGRYEFRGEVHQLPLNETARGHALHGLVAWLDFSVEEQAEDHVRLVGVVQPQQGYPWRVRIESTFTLDPDGLTQQVRASNLSPTVAPYGTGPHPYLVAGPGRVDDWTLELPADRVLLTDDHLAPTELVDVAVDADRFDFRTPRRIGSTEIDHAYAELRPGPDGTVEVRLTGSTGSGVAMVWDSACPWVQIHTADQVDGAANPAHRLGLAVEPMTCAPDAFNRHAAADLIELEPGSSTTASWRIEPIRA